MKLSKRKTEDWMARRFMDKSLLARRAGLNRRTVYRAIELGEEIRFATGHAIAEALGVGVERIAE